MRVHDEVLDLFIELEADEAQLGRAGRLRLARNGTSTLDLESLFRSHGAISGIVEHVPPPPAIHRRHSRC